jgi:fatty acid desaturase
MSELHPIGWYASQVAPHLPKKAFKPVPTRLLGGLAFLVLVVSGIAAIGLYTLNPLIYLALSVVIATGFAGLGFLAHEILHGTVVKTAWLRDLLGGIAFAQFLVGPKLWRKWHNMEHHAHTQDHGTDPDAWALAEPAPTGVRVLHYRTERARNVEHHREAAAAVAAALARP